METGSLQEILFITYIVIGLEEWTQTTFHKNQREPEKVRLLTRILGCNFVAGFFVTKEDFNYL